MFFICGFNNAENRAFERLRVNLWLAACGLQTPLPLSPVDQRLAAICAVNLLLVLVTFYQVSMNFSRIPVILCIQTVGFLVFLVALKTSSDRIEYSYSSVDSFFFAGPCNSMGSELGVVSSGTTKALHILLG